MPNMSGVIKKINMYLKVFPGTENVKSTYENSMQFD